MKPARRHSPTLGWWLAILVLFGVTFASSANGETAVTPQAVALHAEWLRYMPPPAQNPVICLVDTGVDITPDTAPILVGRLSVTPDGGLDDSAPGPGHGTLMASLIGAPVNGWGGVGLWPYARIVSVRAADQPGQFSWQRYAVGMAACAQSPRVVAASISIAGEPPNVDDAPLFQDVVASLANRGISTLAAAGNSGGEVLFPAGAPGVVAVGANRDGGEMCASSSRRRDILTAPGCDVLGVDRSGSPHLVTGTSVASPLAAVLVASLRAYRPDLSRQQVDDLIVSSSRTQADGSRAIDVEAAYAMAGLARAVGAAKDRLRKERVFGASVAPMRGRVLPVSSPQVRWIKVQRRVVIVRLGKPLPRNQRILVFGRRARVLNSTTIRAPRVRNRWKLGIAAVDRVTKRRSAVRNVMVLPLAPKRLVPVKSRSLR